MKSALIGFIIGLAVSFGIIYYADNKVDDITKAIMKDEDILKDHHLNFHDGHPAMFYPEGEVKGIVLILHGGIDEYWSMMELLSGMEDAVDYYTSRHFMVIFPNIPLLNTGHIIVKDTERYINTKMKAINKIMSFVFDIQTERNVPLVVNGASEGGGLFMIYSSENKDLVNERVSHAIFFSPMTTAINQGSDLRAMMMFGKSVFEKFATTRKELSERIFDEYGNNVEFPSLFFYPEGDMNVVYEYGEKLYNKFIDGKHLDNVLITDIGGGHTLMSFPQEYREHVLEFCVDYYPHLQAEIDWLDSNRVQ